ncbi:MAG: radical SAM protein [Deltaproteobacteria bacterium]|nr:radical SAM protein [Deltaproteobacteria bacterium]
MTIIDKKQSYASACANHLQDMPWGDSCNAMATIELTQKCNLSCSFCRRCNYKSSHKSLRAVERELTTIFALSQSDTVVLTGGEPLMYPDLEAAVQMVASVGKKPVMLTNGILSTPERLIGLKAAGLFGVLFNVNARQNRPGWEGCNESELNTLRLKYAELAGEFGLHCGFNTLVFPSTLQDVQRVALWASVFSDRVHTMTFVAARMFDAAFSRSEDTPEERSSIFLSPYDADGGSDADCMTLSSHDLYDQIQKVFPGYRFNSFLGSTAQSGVLKWAMGTHLCRTGKRIGNLGPLAIRIMQRLGRRIAARDMSHFSPSLARQGWVVLLMGLLDKETRRTMWRHLSSAFTKPLELFRTLHLQTFIVMQSIDILPEGERGSCNGCTHMTTNKSNRFVFGGTMNYVLGGAARGDATPEGSAQVQWPKQSATDWRNSELERIGMTVEVYPGMKN